MAVCPYLHRVFSSSFLNVIFILFLYFCLHQAFIAVHGLSAVAKCRLLMAVASLVKHGFQVHGLQ